ncbi:uncharacterized protein LOC143846918 [Tasmannia lanceolata]|uniref:uncharacterized protein LOC143846918 n=1 Tax=Tasmannia lanceolata TaxID=3420 RepID=UPI004064C432
MEASIPSPLFLSTTSRNLLSTPNNSTNFNPNLLHRGRCNHSAGNIRFPARIPAIGDVASAADPARAEITWQIIVGGIAGVTPFVVAGIEFGKRIVAQRRCGVCGGSGLVLRDDSYFRCPGCGGFLPWKSWKRFFSG